MSPVKPPPSSSQMLARLLGTGDDAASGPAGARGKRRLGWITLAIFGLTLILLAIAVWPLIRLRSNPPAPIADANPGDKLVASFESDIEADLAQIEGRSLFAIPLPPSPKQDVAKKSSPKPTRYGGPAVIAMVNNQVWLANGDRLGVGDAKGGVKVISLDAPWSAKLEYEGAEFDVDFFQRSPLLAKGGVMSGSTADAPIVTPSDDPARVPSSPRTTPPPPARGPTGDGTSPPTPEPPANDEPPPAPAEPMPAPGPTPPSPPPSTEPSADPSSPPPSPEPPASDPENRKP